MSTAMPKHIVVRPGEKTPVSGIYHPAGSKHEVTLDRGERVPPNNEGSQQRFTLVRETKHKRK